MSIRAALKEQYHASLAMMADCIEKCPDDLWTSPNPEVDDTDRTIYRAYWRIALHGLFFTQLYMGPSVEQFVPWPERPRGPYDAIWGPTCEVEPFELPLDVEPMTKVQMLDYLAYVDGLVDPIIDAVDLDSPESGVPWYKNFPKLNHELLTLRHLQGHVGQLSELLMAHGGDPKWVSRCASWKRD